MMARWGRHSYSAPAICEVIGLEGDAHLSETMVTSYPASRSAHALWRGLITAHQRHGPDDEL